MYQIDNPTAAPVAPPATPPGAPGFFTGGNLAGGIPATIVTAEWLNMVQAELINAIEALGQTPSKASSNQLALALQPILATVDNLATVATTGSYGDLTNKPALASVATTGSYTDLSNKPIIPPGQVNSDWNAASGDAAILNKPVLLPEAPSDGKAYVRESDAWVVLPPTSIVNLPTTGGSLALDLTPLSQSVPEIKFDLTIPAGTTTLSFTNPPAAGKLGEFMVIVNNNAGASIAWPTSIKWPGGSAPTLTGVAGKLDTFVFYTEDGGATYCGFVAGQNQ